jgi:hypothetical protein
MEHSNLQRRVIEVDPYEVSDETLDALEHELIDQSDITPDMNIELVNSFVLDARPDGGLDSHATVFVSTGDGGDSQ